MSEKLGAIKSSIVVQLSLRRAHPHGGMKVQDGGYSHIVDGDVLARSQTQEDGGDNSDVNRPRNQGLQHS